MKDEDWNSVVLVSDRCSGIIFAFAIILGYCYDG